jgi:hypothetical protein
MQCAQTKSAVSALARLNLHSFVFCSARLIIFAMQISSVLAPHVDQDCDQAEQGKSEGDVVRSCVPYTIGAAP